MSASDSVLDPPQIKPDTGALQENIVEGESAASSTEGQSPDFGEKQVMQEQKPKRFSKLRSHIKRPSKKVALWGGGVLAVLCILLLVFVVIPGVSLAREGIKLKDSGMRVQASLGSQDLGLIKAEIGQFKADLESFRGPFNRFAWTSAVPFVGAYWRDGEAFINAGLYGIEAGEIMIETAEPYADIIGLGGGDAGADETANDRIDFLVQTIESILPRADEIAVKADLARQELNKIDPSRYPETFRGTEIRDNLRTVIELVNTGADFVANGKPLMEAAPYLIGADDTRRYLLIFQNDKELRATGGFLTAYSIIEVSNGKVVPTTSNDIYNLDDKYTPSVEAPEPIIDLIRGPYILDPNYRLRDMNWSPDFSESMEFFLEEAESAGITDVDGVIAVDTEVAVKLLEVIGPIGVGGFGEFSAANDERCDCPQVLYELESYADTEGPVVWDPNTGEIVFAPNNYYNRKDIVGPLMNSMMANALGQPKEKMPELFQAGWEAVIEKHVLLYMFDEEVQGGIEAFGIGGVIEDYDGDYLHVSDSNLGGRKSNLYVTNQVEQDVEIGSDGSVTKTVTLTYNNPQPQDGWLNSVLPNWTRVYVPEGSELVSAEGFDDSAEVYDELGKTVFAGGFELRPQGVQKITLVYKLPYTVNDQYNLFVQKQPGKDSPLYSVEVGNQKQESFLKTDKEYTFRI